MKLYAITFQHHNRKNNNSNKFSLDFNKIPLNTLEN